MHSQSHKLYILVDKTLSAAQQAVQATHAGIEFALKYGSEWRHQSLVLLAVDGEDEMLRWDLKLADGRKASFLESYWDNRLTAIAAHGCDEQVKDLPLL